MLMSYKRGQGSIVLRVKILDSAATTGAGKTGLTSASAGLIISTIADNEASATAYTVTGSTIETITTLGTFAAPTATKCRFKEVDATNHKGVYEIQIADARFAVSSAKSLLVSISGASGAAETDAVIPLMDMDPYDSVRAGLTSLPNAAANANGGLPILSSSGTTLAYTISTLTTYTGNTPQTGDSYARIGATGSGLTSLAPSSTALSTATWTATRAGYIDNLSAGAVALNSGVYLANGAHGGASATMTLQSINVSNSAGDAITVSSTGSNGHAIYAAGNGGGDGMHIVGGSTGHGLHLQGGSTSGDGLHAVAKTAGDGIQATGAGAGVDINGTLSAVTLVNGLAANTITATSIASDAITDAKVASDVTIASVTGSVGSISGVTFPTNFSVLSISATTGLVDITQTAADKVWSTTIRTISAATNITSDGGTISQVQLAHLDADVSSRMATYTQPTGFLAATFPTIVASTTNITGGTITTVGTTTNLTNLPTMPTDWVTAAGLKADAVTEIQSGLSTFNVGTDTVLANITEINSSTLAATKLGAVYDAFENGTAQAGAASSITLANTASSVNDFFKNQAIFLLGGTGAKQTNRITGYNGTTKEATVATPWVTVPDNTTPYFILGRIG